MSAARVRERVTLAARAWAGDECCINSPVQRLASMQTISIAN